MNGGDGYNNRTTDNIPQSDASGKPTRHPRYVELNRLAVVSDLAGGSLYLDAVHKDGMNVAYADGSARWVSKGAMKDPVTGLTHLDPAPFYSNYHSLYNTSVTQYVIPLWMDFDRN